MRGNKPNRTTGFLAGIGLILFYSGIPTGLAVLQKYAAGDPLWIQTILFFSCSISALVLAMVKKQARPTGKNRKVILQLWVAGILAASYFSVIFGVGPAAADWMEKALNPFFMYVVAFILLRERPTINGLLSLGISLVGYVLFLLPSITVGFELNEFLTMGVCLPALGALGSAIGYLSMRKLTQDGIGKFYAISLRYLPVSFLALGLALWKGNAGTMSTTMVLGAMVIGSLFFNCVLFFALIVMERLGTLWLAQFLLAVPILTTIWERLLHLADYSMRADFWIGAMIIFAGAVLGELRK